MSTGILLALGAYGLFTLMDASIKLLGGRYHVVQVVFFNALFGLATVTLIAALRGRLAGVRSPQWRLHLLRWAIGLPGGLAIFWAYPRMPLADVYAILFAAPLFMTALSVPVLAETVGWRRWSAVLVGFLGILVILRPGSGPFGPPALAALFGALVHACNMLLLRRMRGIDPPEAFGIWGNGLSVIATGSVLPWLWRAPTASDLALHGFAGALAGGGFLLLVLAHAKAPVAVLAPFQYSQMLYGIALGALLFGDLPDPATLAGATIVVGSGLYIFHREAVRARPGTT
ncbi:MAG: DMT family transporter [Geminicoccaceae bacterium]|nr:DMT family transporter [Geminicoccaceae bacterium]